MLFTGILSLAACATDGAQSPSAPAQPVASYVSRTGTTIEMYAEGDAAFSVAERGDPAHAQPAIAGDDAKTLSPTQLYLESASDQVVPQAIADLTAELVAAGRTFPAATPPHRIAPAVFDGCEASSFSATWCHLDDGDPITWCLLGETAGLEKHLSSLSSTEAAICIKSGKADYHVTNEAGGDHEWTLSAGGFIKYSFNSAIFSYNWVHYDISGVTGTYQFAGEADD
ncbi:MAG TPA: hypothetical protein VLX92_09945 [Kofleriaceae bacterium]|nr:hypothetical protein [Kofleriaceae bacterium]